MKSRLLWGLLLFAGLAFSTEAAQAQGWGGGGSWYGGPWYNSYGMDNMPYYALHPPVYYSYPVPRTYGYSPFAYPPTVRTPDVSYIRSQTTRNPYHCDNDAAQSGNQTTSAADNTVAAIAPLRMANPFYQPNEPERLSQQVPLSPRTAKP